MKKKVFRMLLTLAMIFSMMPAAVHAADQTGIQYIDENGELQSYVGEYTTVTEDTSSMSDGWYLVTGDVTIEDQITVTGDVVLVLGNGATLDAKQGIIVNKEHQVTITAQSVDDLMGHLIANGGDKNAGIGGGDGGNIVINGGNISAIGGTNGGAGIGGWNGDAWTESIVNSITINGGKITATGIKNTAGIGSGNHGDVNSITINGGIISAVSNTEGGAGIGSTAYGNVGSILITGGSVTAEGGEKGAGIGSGWSGDVGDIKITGGEIIATGGMTGGAGIGSGYVSDCSNIVITGGTITANGGKDGAAGIGGGYWYGGVGDIEISGGIVFATGGSGGAGIGGGGYKGTSGNITLKGGIITATGGSGADDIGNGSDYKSSASFYTEPGSDVVIYANSIVGSENTDDWSCIWFKGTNGTAYGEIQIDSSVTIQSNETLEIPNGSILTVADQGSLENKGTINNLGKIQIEPNGSYTGNAPLGNPVEYVTTYFDPKTNETKSVAAKEFAAETSLTDGWYLVSGTNDVSQKITVSGSVHLILADDAVCNVSGIDINQGGSLAVYSQSDDINTMGILNVTRSVSSDGAINYSSNEEAASSREILTINGGKINIKNSASDGRGICTNTGTVSINGGRIDISSGYDGIYYDPNKPFNNPQTVISGGIVTIENKSGTSLYNLSTSKEGHAVIYADSIGKTDNKNSWNCILFKPSEHTGSVCGNVTLMDDLAIDETVAFNVPATSSLIIPEGVSFSNNGSIANDGTINVNIGGTYTGEQPANHKVNYQIGWDTNEDNKAEYVSYYTFGDMPNYDKTMPSKEGTDHSSYAFIGWLPEVTTVTESKLYTAQFEEIPNTYTVTLPTNPLGYQIGTEDSTTVEYGKTFQFTVNIENGYKKADHFAVKANGNVLTPDEEGVYTVTVNGETEINVEGVVDGIAPTFTGITPDATYYTTQKVTVNDTNLDSVTVNGKKVEGTSFTLAGNTDMTYTIAAKDKAGNSASITVYMKNISSLTPSDAITTADKQQLEEKKDSLTELLNNENLTNQEKEQLQAVLDKVNAALESIEKITSMQEAIDKLPVSLEPDDLAAIEQIETIAEQYDQLSGNEKQQLSTSIDKLNQLLADSKNYQILAGKDSVWYKGSNQDLTITANGAPERLDSLLLDGKTLAKEAYTVQKGSTIVTLKASYLDKLAAGEHTLTFVYVNGETKVNFTIVAPAQQENENPTENSQTSAANTILPWAVFAVVCAGAVIALIVYRKKNSH